jgi:hypothetical protein
VNSQSFRQAVGYDYFYRQAQNLAEVEAQTFVISARTPLAAFLRDFGYSETAQPGVYRSSQGVLKSIGLVVLNELAAEGRNAFVQCFASRRRVRASRRLEGMAWESLGEEFWAYVVGLRSVVGEKGEDMEEGIINEVLTPEVILEMGKRMRKALLATLTSEEMQEVIARALPEERLTGLAPEEMIALMRQSEAYLRAHTSDVGTLSSQAKQPPEEA